MVNITDMPQYINLSKLSEYNTTIPLVIDTEFSTVFNAILGTFAKYTILQWGITIILFISLFIIMRYFETNDFINLSNMQIAALTSFILSVFYSVMLFIEVFTILQPLETLILIWLVSVIILISKKG